jgi:putative ABC transport system permease protein
VIAAELRSLFARKLRTVLTTIAIILGVSMISGTYVLTDTITRSFDDIFRQATVHISAVVVGRSAVSAVFGDVPTVPASLLPTVQSAKGVAAADGEVGDSSSVGIYGPLTRNKDGSYHRSSLGSVGNSPNLLGAVGDQRFNSLSLVTGSWPHGWQVALDDATMSRHNLRIGETVYIVTKDHPFHAFTITGSTRFGSAPTILGATLLEMDLATAQKMSGLRDQYDRISAAAAPGYSDKQVAANIRKVIPAAFRGRVTVKTGAKEAAEEASAIGKALHFVTIALLAFAGIAVFVGAFIIFNTFSITVAQRAREFALFRTLGASRRQILQSVVMESMLIGVLGSVMGLFAGFGVAEGLNAVFKIFGADLLSGPLLLATRTVFVTIGVGTVVTCASALIPAIRATRVPPIAALREGSPLPNGRLSAFMPAIAVGVVAIGFALTAWGVLGSFAQTDTRLLIIGIGCVLFFLGVAMFSPQLVRPIAGIVGWPIERFSSITGRLARDNATRNPSRTAITAAALMVGLALVGFVTIFAAELRQTASDTIDREIAGSFIVENVQSEGNTIPYRVLPQLTKLPGVTLASGLAEDVAHVNGLGKNRFTGVQPSSFGRVYRFQWKEGSEPDLDHLGRYQALIGDGFASPNHLHVGSVLHVVTRVGKHDTFAVAGIYKSSAILTDIVIPLNTLRTDWKQPDLIAVAVNKAPTASEQRVENAITNSLEVHYPFLTVNSQAQYKNEQLNSINGVLALIYVLLALSIIVSLFGIVNTLILSIYERTREIGMLRAIGVTRSQIRWTIRWESVITSLIGAILGLVLGVVLAILITLGLQSEGIEFAFPVGELLLFLVFAIVFGIVAAALPARRAARLDVLNALADE